MAAFTELLPPAADRTEQWHERRVVGVTASEVAAILGLSPYDSPFNVWHRKAGTLPPDHSDNEQMRWGRRLEDAICAEFSEQHPDLHVVKLGLCASVQRPWQLATPDRGVFDSETLGVTEIDDVFHVLPIAGVEAKTTDSWDGWGDEGTDQIPVEYRCQALWQADVLGVDCIYVPALSRGKDYREYVLTMDDDARADLEIMRQAALAFRESVVNDQPPGVDAHVATTSALRRLHPDVENVDVEVPAALADTYRRLKAEEKRIENELSKAGNELLAAIGDGRRAVDPDGNRVASRSVFERNDLDSKALSADHPDIAEQYRKTTTVAQLRATPKPKEKGSIQR